ncbi:hypothetical protein BJV78DRAFT_897562 [Lactifluus subvellereus]|nr:hypothetical protein BJV78DRAFT_897562 [Lactifluus subvellereus]
MPAGPFSVMVERSGCRSMSPVVCWLWARVHSFFQLTIFSPWALASVFTRKVLLNSRFFLYGSLFFGRCPFSSSAWLCWGNPTPVFALCIPVLHKAATVKCLACVPFGNGLIVNCPSVLPPVPSTPSTRPHPPSSKSRVTDSNKPRYVLVQPYLTRPTSFDATKAFGRPLLHAAPIRNLAVDAFALLTSPFH